MPRNQIVINVDIGETRVALIENGIVTELHIERRGERDVVGNVYLGRVTRVLPGMNAAFVDIGLERAAFLHVEDVITEGELRALAPGDDDEDVPEDVPVPTERVAGERTSDAGEDEDAGDDDVAASAEEVASQVEAEADAQSDAADAEGAAGPDEAGDEADDAEEGDETDDAEEGEEGDEAEGVERAAAGGEGVAAAPRGATARSSTSAGAAEPGAERRGGGGRRGRRGRSGRGRRKDAPRGGGGTAGGGGAAPMRAKERSDRGDRGGRGKRDHRGDRGADRGGERGDRGGDRGERVERSGGGKPIRDLLREGQEIVVQVSKGPISTKGARCTSHVSLPGRYVVYMPTVAHLGVSKRIGNDKERKRLREVIEQLKPEKGGLIVRTASEGLTKKQLKNDVGYLVQLWGDIWKKREGAKAPALLYSELDVVLRTVRDVMGPDIEKIVIDDKEAHARCVRFVEQFMPDRKDDVLLYSGTEPVFDEYGIEDEIGRALSRKVPLKSGGYLIIDQAEALTAIDVNSGRFVGKKDVEETVTQTNLEAVAEIAYQLRLRNLGGLIILDLIDMDRQGNRDKVYKALNEALKQDKAKTSILRISELGLVEMTRKRTRESLGRQLYEPCFYCDGTGHTQSKMTIAYEILRQIRREKDQLAGYTVMVNAHPAVADVLKHEARDVLQEAERRYMRKIVVASKPEYHIEQFDLQGR